MRRVTREKIMKIHRGLEKAAIVLRGREGVGITKDFFLSQLPWPAGGGLKPHHYINPSASVDVVHFVPMRCTSKSIMDRMAVCLCFDEAKKKYYITRHRVGKCPWRMKGERNE